MTKNGNSLLTNFYEAHCFWSIDTNCRIRRSRKRRNLFATNNNNIKQEKHNINVSS